MYPLSRPLQAVCFMLASMALFALMGNIVRLLSYEMHSTQMVLLRNGISLVIIVAIQAVILRGRPRFPTTRLKGHFWRATAGIVSMELWFYSLTIMPVTLATALSFMTPIFTTIIAIFFLGERAGIRRWGAIMAGFLGMLVILRPDIDGISLNAWIVLASSACMAVAGVLVKTLTRTESPEVIVFYMALFMIPWSVGPALLHWHDVTPYQWWLVFLIALTSTVSHLLLTRALVRADMVMLMPFDFTRLIFVAIFAWFLFGETLDMQTILGSLIIVASTVYIAHREAKKGIRPSGLGIKESF